MSANVEPDHQGTGEVSDGLDYPTVRQRITEQADAVKASAEDERIYKIQRHFQDFAISSGGSSAFVNGILGALTFLAFMILYPLMAAIIKWCSKGPVIYRQERTGKDGKQFTCYKFRTMHQIDLRRIDGKPTITTDGDKRIFKFGHFLRRTSLDELPQIINVIKGEMNLIGPRPYPVDECAYWNATFDDFYFRYAAKPGITGLAQINGFRGGTLDRAHMRKRLDYDLIYLRNASFKLDLHIIGKTFGKIFRPDGGAH